MSKKHEPSNRSAGKPHVPTSTVGYSRNSVRYFPDASSSLMKLPRNVRRFGASSSTLSCSCVGCLRDVWRCWWLAANSDILIEKDKINHFAPVLLRMGRMDPAQNLCNLLVCVCSSVL